MPTGLRATFVKCCQLVRLLRPCLHRSVPGREVIKVLGTQRSSCEDCSSHVTETKTKLPYLTTTKSSANLMQCNLCRSAATITFPPQPADSRISSLNKLCLNDRRTDDQRARSQPPLLFSVATLQRSTFSDRFQFKMP